MKYAVIDPARVVRLSVAASSSGANEIVAAVTGGRIILLSCHLSFAGTVNAKWQSASTDLTGHFIGSYGLQINLPYSPVGHVETAAGEALNLNLSGATAVRGFITYCVET